MSTTIRSLVAILLALGAAGCAEETVVDSKLRPYLYDTNGWPVAGSALTQDSSRAFRIILFLGGDFSATVFYEEGFHGHGFNPWREWAYTRTRVSGSWEERPDGSYSVAGLLECEVDAGLENEVLACTLQHDLASPGATGVAVRIPPRRYGKGTPVGDTVDDPFYAEFRERDVDR